MDMHGYAWVTCLIHNLRGQGQRQGEGERKGEAKSTTTAPVLLTCLGLGLKGDGQHLATGDVLVELVEDWAF